jgi:Cu(I)/Ag(I) efflux system membrane fusion protein
MTDPIPERADLPAADPDQAPEPPPRGVKTMAAVRWTFLVLAATAALWTWAPFVMGQRGPDAAAHMHAAKTRYRCPMHPQIVSDQPGECPICHMTLQPFVEKAPASAPPDRPASAPADVPAGTTPVVLTFDRIQSIGVRTALADQRDAGGSVRVTATVAAPEQGAAEVHVRAPGFVERISVRETGIKVGAGQELLGVYSPEILQGESELVAAQGFGEAGARTVEGARQKLELLGMSPRLIDQVVATSKPLRVVPVVSPAGGYVSRKNVVLGSYVTPETTLYEIVDLSHVYVIADVFPRDIGQIHPGTEGRFSVAQHPDTPVSARVDLVYPQLNAESRTTRVRMQVKNDKLELLPGQYGTVEFTVSPSKVVVVPRDAVVDTGRSTYVFVDEGGGRFTPRTVTLGRDLEDGVAIQTGISAGERVVSGGTFLVDSESRLRASLAAAGSGAPGQGP